MNQAQATATQIFELSRHGEVKFRGTQDSCYISLQKMQSQSADWAIRYEGWKVEPRKYGAEEAEQILDADPYVKREVELLEDADMRKHSVKCLYRGEEKRALVNAMSPCIAKAGQKVHVMQSFIFEPYK
jgi:hypothetical protein